MEPFTTLGWSSADLADPYPIYRRYREADPVHRAGPSTWFVFDHEHVAQALSRRDFGRNRPAHLPGRNDALYRSVRDWLVFLDPPRHTRLRRLLAAEFSPKVVLGLRPRIAAIVASLLRPLRGRTEFDLVREFAAPLPVLVISALLGVPGERHAWFRERAEWLQEASSARAARDSGGLARAETAARELTEYFDEQVRARRSAPRGDLVSLLAGAPGLTGDELTATCVHLLTAGHETTTNLLGKSVLHLSARPDLAKALRAAPALVPSAVAELVRFDAPVQMVTRWATGTQELGGRRIAAGDKVVLVLGAANRDPVRFTAPDDIVLERDTSRQCGFGMGIHYCLGAQLARAEAELALPPLLELLRGFAVSEARYAADLVFHGPAALTLRAIGTSGSDAPAPPAR
jgi:cytochrome P450 StaP